MRFFERHRRALPLLFALAISLLALTLVVNHGPTPARAQVNPFNAPNQSAAVTPQAASIEVQASEPTAPATNQTTPGAAPAPTPNCIPSNLSELPSADTATPGLNISQWSQTYTVHGSSRSELINQIAQCGPLAPNETTRYWAYAQWRIDFRYEYASSSDACDITSLSVGVNTRTTIPAAGQVGDQLLPNWNRMVGVITAHENQHASHGTAAGTEFYNQNVNASAADCSQLRQQISTSFNQIVTKYKQADIDYDVRTNHGANEGVWL